MCTQTDCCVFTLSLLDLLRVSASRPVGVGCDLITPCHIHIAPKQPTQQPNAYFLSVERPDLKKKKKRRKKGRAAPLIYNGTDVIIIVK